MKLIVFGDSISTDIGYAPQIWPSLVAADLGFTLENHSVPSSRAVDQLAVAQSLTLPSDGAIFAIMLGVNDVTYDGTDSVKRAASIEALADLIHVCCNGGNPHILVLNVPVRHPDVPERRVHNSALSEMVTNMRRGGYNTHLVNIAALIQPSSLDPDGIHIHAPGHLAISQMCTADIRENILSLHSPVSLQKSLLPYLAYRDQLGPCECSPFVHDGQLYTVTSYLRLQAETVDRFRIDGMLDRSIVEVDVPDLGYPNAFTKDGTIYVFGTSKDHKRITRTESTDLVNWSAPQTVFTSTNDDNLYNVSICPDSTGYMMAVEVTNTTDFPGPNRFVNRFIHSTDLATWTSVPGLLDNGSFVNCPVIRFYDGKYYVLYMTLIPETEYPSGRHMTLIARSSDFITWEHGSGFPDGFTVPLAPDNVAVEGTNTSDIDMVEFEGKTYFVYARGDQFNWTWLEVSSAVFEGTEKQFLQSFYATNP